jgi:hypothetical protein
MSSRYQDIQLKKTEDGKRVTRSVIYPPIPKTVDDIYVLTTPGDRLDLLAHKYYKDVNMAWIIAEANGVGKGTYSIAAGTQLRIPANREEIMAEYKRLNG